jgi:hypothetical protein
VEFSTPRILGFGRQTSLADIVKLAAAEMERTHGRPQKLQAVATGIQIEADRSRSDGPLDMYIVRLEAEPQLLESVRKLAANASFAAAAIQKPEPALPWLPCRI